MKRVIKSYNQFNRINEEEEINLKKAAAIGGLAAASLFPMSAKGQSTQLPREKERTQVAKDTIRRNISTTDSLEAQMWMRKNYNLDSIVEINQLLNSYTLVTVWDTIQKVAPDTIVGQETANFDAGKFFKSGYFKLDDASKEYVRAFMDGILESGNIVAKVTIESSTDKQQLKPETKQRLKSAGYEESNSGLSLARNDEIARFLDSEYGIDGSLIERNLIVQGGTGTIDQSARYVKVTVEYINITSFVANTEPQQEVVMRQIPKQDEVTKKIYYLSKEIIKDPRDSSKRKKPPTLKLKKGGKQFNPIKQKSCPKITKKQAKPYRGFLDFRG